jgi:hypothetical protein
MPKVGGKPHSFTLEGVLIPLLCGHAVRLPDIPRGFMCVTSSMVLRCTNVGHSVHLASWSSAFDYPSSGFKMQTLRIPFHRLAANLQIVKHSIIPTQRETIRPGFSTYEISPLQSYEKKNNLTNRTILQSVHNKFATRKYFTKVVLIISELRKFVRLPKPRVAGSSPVYRSRAKWLETSNLRC